MAMTGRTFSDSWHQVAEQRFCLRPTVRVRKQMFRGEKWYVLTDPFNNTFFRLRPEAHGFVMRLKLELNVNQVWEQCLARDPDEAPGQQDVIQLLTQLYFANLLICNSPADSAKIFERRTRRRQREIRSKLLGIMFLRIPLFDPDRLLRRCEPLIKCLSSPLALSLWVFMALWSGMTVMEQFADAAADAGNILAPGNLVLLYAALVLIKTWHEIGHAVLCRRFGGEVHVMGVMLMIFTPLPYMDATSSWSFRSRTQRILVSAAGMVFELFIAFCAALIWANSGPGVLHSLMFNLMFIASVSTLVFNANPLLRYDGYYILCDLIDIPNLNARAITQLKYLSERYVFGCRDAIGSARSDAEGIWLTCYGLLSGVYRLIVYGGIILFVADRFLLAGLVMALFCLVTWVLLPVSNFVVYLQSNPKLSNGRTRALAIIAGGVFLCLVFFALVPFPSRFRAPGVLESETALRMANDTEGLLAEILVPNGSSVVPGTALLRLENPELDMEIRVVSSQRDELLAMRMQSIVMEGDAERAMLSKRLETLDERLKWLNEQRRLLVVEARAGGIWVSPKSPELIGAWIRRGSELGMIVNPRAFRFSAVVSQEEAANLFSDAIAGQAEVRLSGQGGRTLEVESYQFIPFNQERLPSAALGQFAGGVVPVSGKDESGRSAIEPFFQIYGKLAAQSFADLHHGHSGQILFPLRPEPLLSQWIRTFRQLLQRRYQV